MKLFPIVAAMCVLCEAANAQTPDCRSIPDPAARLACYDRSAPSVASSPATRQAMRAAPAPKVDGAGYVDSIAAEDALMKDRMKGICRGC